MIIGLTGYAGSGKDTAAGQLVERYGFERRAFADALKKVAYDLDPIVWFDHSMLSEFVDRSGWDKAKRIAEVREFLQRLGVACREHIDEHVWVDALERSMFGVEDGFFEDDYRLRRAREGNWVIPDVRFVNESEWVTDLGGVVVRIERPGVGPVNGHVSEQPIEADYVVVNDGMPEELGSKIMAIIKGD